MEKYGKRSGKISLGEMRLILMKENVKLDHSHKPVMCYRFKQDFEIQIPTWKEIEISANSADSSDTANSANTANTQVFETNETSAYKITVTEESLEAERKVIEAKGIADANEIISHSLSTNYLQWYWIGSLENHDSVMYVPISDRGLPIFKEVDSVGGFYD